MRIRLLLWPLLALALAAGCAGGGSHALPSAPGSTGASKAHANVAVSITIPARTASIRHRQSVSAETQSVAITVNSGTAQTFAATPTSPGCSAGSNGTTCQFTVGAPLGNDSFLVQTFSGSNGGGALLDQATESLTVVAGVNSPLTITLGPTVSTTADSGPGSLRDAIANANAGDTIGFSISAPATITLTSGPIAVSKDVTITGPTGDAITVSGGGSQQIFTVASGVTAAIQGLTLANGSAANANGGAIDNSGTLTLSGDTLSNNIVTGTAYLIAESSVHRRPEGAPSQPTPAPPSGVGGAVMNESGATLTVTNSTFTGNAAASGGAIFSIAGTTLTITGSTFGGSTVSSGNSAVQGGAVFIASGAAAISTSTFQNNSVAASGGSDFAVVGGGAVFDEDSVNALTLNGNTFKSNSATSSGEASGGAIATYAVTTSTGDTFGGSSSASGNSVSSSFGYGGAIYSTANLTLTNTAVSNNACTGLDSGGYGGSCNGAGIVDTDPIDSTPAFTMTGGSLNDNIAFSDQGDGYGGALGGAIFANGATVTISNATIAGNQAVLSGGGIWANENLTISGSTIDGNTASLQSGSAEGAGGGGLYASGGGTLTNDTITGNTAQGVSGGGIYVSSYDVTLNLLNVTLDANTVNGEENQGGDVYVDPSGSLTMQGTILADGQASGDASNADAAVSGTLTSNGYNLLDTNGLSSPPPENTGDIFSNGITAGLLPLASNGGPTQTMADQATSPGTDAIPLSVCTSAGVTTDQRGVTRGDGGDERCDIGAYEGSFPYSSSPPP